MKVVFSRKGFDGTSGGCPSPIFPDGTLLSLPIPDQRSPVRYRDLDWNGRNLGDLVERLTRGKVRGRHGAHLDPDLRPQSLPRQPGWRPLLGQCDAAQGHLRNQGVGEGDLFLFWGAFRAVDGDLRWRGPRLHLIWGWLRVGEVVGVDGGVRGERRWAWSERHPHLVFGPDPTNTLYVAPDPAEGGGSLAAFAFPEFAAARMLTAPHATNPSLWSLPAWFLARDRPALSFHENPARWSRRNGGALLRTVARGQEFVLDADSYPEARGWFEGLVGPSAVPPSGG